MEPLKEEALYEAFSMVKGKAKNLTPFAVSAFETRPLKNGTDFSVRKKKAVELPRIDEKVTEDIDLNEVIPMHNEPEPIFDSTPVKEPVPVVVEERPVVEKKKAKASSSTKRKKKSNKRRYDIDLIS